MSFLNPFFFIALAAAIIPVVIHFLQFRRPRKVAFSTLVFFRQLQESTVRRIQLKKYLLLAARLLAVLFLALALARPFLPSEASRFFGAGAQSGFVAVVIDNGPSMAQVDMAGPYLDQAVEAARVLLERSAQGTRFLVLPSHGQPETLRWLDAREADQVLERIEIVNRGNYLTEHMQVALDRLSEEPADHRQLFWISDARKTHLLPLVEAGDLALEGAEPASVHFMKVGQATPRNAAVVSVETTGRIAGEGIPVGVAVTVQNFGTEPLARSYLSLEIEGERIGQYEVELAPGARQELLFEVVPEQPGTIRGKALLESGTFSFDQTRNFTIEVPEPANVLLLTGSERGAAGASRLVSLFRAVSQTGSLMHAEFADAESFRQIDRMDFDAIVLEGLNEIPEYMHAGLADFVQQGRSLWFLPTGSGSMPSYNRFLQVFNAGSFTGMRGVYGRSREVASLQPLDSGQLLAADLFESDEDEIPRIDMPSIYHYLRVQPASGNSAATLLQTNLDEPLFVEQRFGEGMLIVSAMGFEPGWSDLGTKPIYAPLVYRLMMHMLSADVQPGQEHILGRSFDRIFASRATEVLLRHAGDTVVPEVSEGTRGLRVRYAAREWEPGWMDVDFTDHRVTIAVNQDITESDFAALSIAEASEQLGNLFPRFTGADISGLGAVQLRSAVASAGFGREIWSWFVWIALAFLVAECIISKLYKTETVA